MNAPSVPADTHPDSPPPALTARAAALLRALAVEIGARPTGSVANQRAVDFFAATIAAAGMQVLRDPFTALDWHDEGATLSGAGDATFTVIPSPFSPPLELEAPLAVATTIAELETGAVTGAMRGALLLLAGPIAADQLFPRNYPFVTFDEHQRIYRALDTAQPAAVLTASPRNQMAGALYPAPMFEDGDFTFPSAYLSAEEGSRLAQLRGSALRLSIRSQRRTVTAQNVVARRGEGLAPVIVLAHIDSKPTTPGALDNATGIVTLLLLGELLRDAPPHLSVELVAINGEDYYSAGGEMAFLQRSGARLPELRLGINIDGIGYCQGASAFSLYNMDASSPHATQASHIRNLLGRYPNLIEGPDWIQSDHAMFVMAGTPALAFTSERLDLLFTTLWHTADDTPDVVDPARIAELALALRDLLTTL